MSGKRKPKPYEIEIERLRTENFILRKELEQRKVDLNNTYILMSDNFTLRRRMETMEEQIDLLEEKLAAAIERGDRATRGLKNLQKWLEIDGYEGAKIFGQAINKG